MAKKNPPQTLLLKVGFATADLKSKTSAAKLQEMLAAVQDIAAGIPESESETVRRARRFTVRIYTD